MNPKNIKKYPPIVVSIVVMILFSACAVREIVAEQPAAQPQPTAAQVQTTASPIEPQDTPEPNNTSEPEPTYVSAVHSRDWDGDESQMLMKIAMAEAEGESVEGKALVMLVVLNRVWSDYFPDSIEAVIFQHNGGVWQFSPVAEGGRYFV